MLAQSYWFEIHLNTLPKIGLVFVGGETNRTWEVTYAHKFTEDIALKWTQNINKIKNDIQP
jgi:hypothetical protein